MISDKDIESVRGHFVRASHEFGFKLIMPFRIDEDEPLLAFAYLPDYGSSNGAIVMLGEPTDFERDHKIVEWARKHGYFYSILNIQPLLSEYDREYFVDLLDDWKIK